MEHHFKDENVNLLNFDTCHSICICNHLVNKGDFDALHQFLISFTSSSISEEFYEHFRFSWTYLYANLNQFDKVYEIITSTTFSQKYHKKLQNLWYECHYREEELKKKKKLNPVERYRVRRKYQPPRTISTGEKTVYNMLESSITRLYRVFDKSKYPDQRQKQMLARETRLTMDQINNWFKNKRQRLKRNLAVGKTK